MRFPLHCQAGFFQLKTMPERKSFCGVGEELRQLAIQLRVTHAVVWVGELRFPVEGDGRSVAQGCDVLTKRASSSIACARRARCSG